MDYIDQMEKLYKFFALTLSAEQMYRTIELKRKFSNDLNLLGCFIKDFLTIENSFKVPLDENIYTEFVLYYEKNIHNLDDILLKLKNYSKHFLDIVFETVDNKDFEGYIQTINSCYFIEVYPYLIKIFDDFYNQRVDDKNTKIMLESLVNIVIKRFENPNLNNNDIFEEIKIERLAS